MTHVMVTGTREGMTISQWAAMQSDMEHLFVRTESHVFRDGDCVGADTQAHSTVEHIRSEYGIRIEMYGHPCNLDRYRAHNEYDMIFEVKPPLVRNRDMVDGSEWVLAGPKEFEEVGRGSGTWATIRYARRHEKKLIIFWPDGTKSYERCEPVLAF